MNPIPGVEGLTLFNVIRTLFDPFLNMAKLVFSIIFWLGATFLMAYFINSIWEGSFNLAFGGLLVIGAFAFFLAKPIASYLDEEVEEEELGDVNGPE